MGAIVDTLHIGQDELRLIQDKYPNCKIICQSQSDCYIQKYRVIIPTDDWCIDHYYEFLVQSGMAMASAGFLGRISSDQKFVDRMRAWVAENVKESGRDCA